MPRRPDAVITPNPTLREARERTPSPWRTGQAMSRTELADAVNNALDQLYPGRDLTAHYVDSRWIGKLERGEHRWPSDERRAALRHALGTATDTQLGLYIPRHTDSFSPTLTPLESAPGACDGQRALSLVGSLAAAEYVGLEEILTSAALRSGTHAREVWALMVPADEIDQLRGDIRMVARTFDVLVPEEAVNTTLRIRDSAASLLSRTHRPGQLNDLYLVLAQAVSLLASASIDLGLWTTASRYTEAAEEYGDIAGHAGAQAYALGLRATVAYWTGHADDAVQLAGRAVQLAPVGIARARALSILARAWSHNGAVDEVRQALNDAADARTADGTDELHDVVGGEFGFSAPQQARSASTAWLQVGQAPEAAGAAQAALDALAGTKVAPERWPTVESEARADLATCQLLAGEPEAARESLLPLWSMPPSWRRAGLIGRVHRVQEVLTDSRLRAIPAAREVAAEAMHFVSTAAVMPELPPA